MSHHRTSGFTLVEMSIVLIVVGFLVGGVIAGASIKRNMEMQATITDFQKYVSAAQAFRDKYGTLPGDMPNATDYWGTAAGGCPTPGTGTGTQTCNGDGDGRISNSDFSVMPTEVFRFWQQLGIAGMVEGSYTGTTGAGGAFEFVPARNIPQSKINRSGGYWPVNMGLNAGDTEWFPDQYGTIMLLGGFISADVAYAPLLTTEEALSIDTKMDDGKPGTGTVMAFRSTSTRTPNCTSTAATDTSAYITNLTATPAARGNKCILIFKTGLTQ